MGDLMNQYLAHKQQVQEHEATVKVRQAIRLLERSGYTVTGTGDAPDIREAKRLVEQYGYEVGKRCLPLIQEETVDVFEEPEHVLPTISIMPSQQPEEPKTVELRTTLREYPAV
jgi:hypothetical protein